MTLKILSFAALAGMFTAAGCGGGSGSGTPPLSGAPAIGGSAPSIGGTAPSAKGRGSFVASFNIPYSAARASASSSRSPKYLSPGTTGLIMFLGNSLATDGAPGGGTTTLTTGVSAPAAGAGQVTVAATAGIAIGSTLTIPGITVTANGLGGLDVFTVTAVTSATVVTGTWASAGFGVTAGGGTVTVTYINPGTIAQKAVIGSATAALALQPGGGTQSMPLTVNGATANSSVTYSFAPSATAGYYTFSAAFNNFTAGAVEHLGVVTTDIAHNNFVLSEGTSGAITVANGPASPVTLTLKPVVAGVYAPTPAATGVAGSYETTVFATDEMGYVIPTISASVPDNTPAITITPTVGSSLTLGYFTGVVSSPNTVTSPTALPAGAAASVISGTLLTGLDGTESGAQVVLINSPTAIPGTGNIVINGVTAAYTAGAVSGLAPTYSLSIADSTSLIPLGVLAVGTAVQIPVSGAAFALTSSNPVVFGNGAPVTNALGTYISVAAPSGPDSVSPIAPTGSTANPANTAGNPLNILCTSAAADVAYQATITSSPPTAVVGFTYTDTNYPPTTGTAINLGSVNCSPGFSVPIN